jgi:hypothetical protein
VPIVDEPTASTRYSTFEVVGDTIIAYVTLLSTLADLLSSEEKLVLLSADEESLEDGNDNILMGKVVVLLLALLEMLVLLF